MSVAGAVHALQWLLRLFRTEARELVAHADEELRLALACLRELLALVLDFVMAISARSAR